MPAVFFRDDAKIPDMCHDEVFKAVFTRDIPQSRKALSGLVSACIKRKVSVLALNANEPAPTHAGDKKIRYDIACRRNGEADDSRRQKLQDAVRLLADGTQENRAETLLNLFSDLDPETQEGKERTHPF